jgi:hypothetical protein
MMKRFSILSALILALGLMAAPAALAQQAEFSEWILDVPTEVGGTVLQPGTYRISVLPTMVHRNIVRVTSADGLNTHFTTVATVPIKLDGDAANMERGRFIYYPDVPGQPRVLKTWIAATPPTDIGHQIVYSESRARELARLGETNVVAYRDTVTTADLETTELEVVTPDARVETYVVPTTRVAEVRTELPRTASTTPLLALLGLVAIAGAFAIRIAIR